ncbi:interleukin-20 receptor subunit beta isoform X5 [Moschus berezovskii]|uniref:interleukin-20 receptor subunit beta isoform X5 n=1 Tax=Moschus berezovskii TaxID=68408 RepID=UPI0024441E02|nr:interleukin-20 receptor subunit beta isoform X5 [Moschus berezovskii]
MVLEEIKINLIMWFSYALIPCLFVGNLCFFDPLDPFINLTFSSMRQSSLLRKTILNRPGACLSPLVPDGVAVLPAPQNLSVQSTNMKHVLTWSPVIVPEEIIHYSVEYQGEYESLYMSHIWIPSSWCSPTQRPECDITEDITATVSYSLRVRATLGSLTSAWSTLKHRFNQNSRTRQSGEAWGPSCVPGDGGARGGILCEGPDVREGHWAAQCLQPDRMCQGARRGPASGAGPVRLRGLRADPGGGAALRLEDGPAAPALLLPRGDASRHLENNKFTPEVNQLQKRRGRSLCNFRALF